MAKTKLPQQNELYFVDDTSSAILLNTPKRTRLLVWTILLFFLAMLTWAYFAELDEVTVGSGKVIPSSQLQVVQNLEGGILRETFIKEGDIVEIGQPIMRIDDTRFKSDFREQEQQFITLQSDVVRLKSELESVVLSKDRKLSWQEQVYVKPVELQYPSEYKQKYPHLVVSEQAHFDERLAGLINQLLITGQQVEQKKQELVEVNSKVRHLRRSYNLVNKELKLTQPLAKEGVVSQVELIKLERQVNDIASELASSRLLIPKLKSVIQENINKRREGALDFRKKVIEELGQSESKLAVMGEAKVGLEDRVSRTTVVSPVKGKVKTININTLGGVIQPGMDLVEIVPLEDNLLIEAKILPKDIAFLRPGLDVVVKFTAYDFAIYGGLKGSLEHISADTIQDEEGNSFYLVRVRTDKSQLGEGENPLPIIPGMLTSVDVLTGKKSVLDYLLKPILRAQQSALRER